MASYKSGQWSGISTFFNFKKDSFPAGFVQYIKSSLEKRGNIVQLVRKDLPAPLGARNAKVDEFPEDSRYDYQSETVDRLINRGGMVAQIATGGGKCLGVDTPVLMHDGTIKPVQDVNAGDMLMGPDSKPRCVLSTVADVGELYRVTPKKGDAYVVNDAHILSLKKTSRGYRGSKRGGEKYPKGEIVNINVEEYLRQNKTFKHVHKGWRTGVDFESSPLPIDPYFFGAMMGDGTINGCVSITTMDKEIVSSVEKVADDFSLSVRVNAKPGNKASSYSLTTGRTGGKENPLMAEFRQLGYIKSTKDNKSVKKFIPHSYKTASREDRLHILAGIIDTDGNYDGKCVYLTLKEERLFDDILFVVRSLGFAAYKKKVRKTCANNGVTGDYFSMIISGDTSVIPVRLERKRPSVRAQKKDVLVTGVTVESIGEGNYYGFEIDGDHLFMLGDFTVTHNTRIAKLAYKRINRPTLFLTTRGVLMHQMKKAFEDMGDKVGVIGDGIMKPTRGFNVGMVQTFAAMLKDPNANATKAKQKEQLKRQALAKKLLDMFEFVILEEAHEVGGNSYFDILNLCKNAEYRLALTATPFMRADGESNMRLMASVGSIGIKVTEKLLIDRGILAKPIFKIIETEKPKGLFRTTGWQKAYKAGIVESSSRNSAILFEAERASKYGMPIMILVQHKAHGELLKTALNKAGVVSEFIYGKHESTQRTDALRDLGSGKIDVLIGSTILDVGVDVPAVGMVILAGGGKAEVALRQRIGRGLRAKKNGPNVAFIIDFSDSHNSHLKKHSLTRRAIIEGTKGFSENILQVGADFDFNVFSKKRAA